jgi:hypothetical protein
MAVNKDQTYAGIDDDAELARQLIEEQKAKEEAARKAAEETARKAAEETAGKQTTTLAPASKDEELSRKKDFAALLEEKIYNRDNGANNFDAGDVAEAKRLGISGERLQAFVDKAVANRAAGVGATYYKPTPLGSAPVEESKYATQAQTENFWGKVDKNTQDQAAGVTGKKESAQKFAPPAGTLSGLDELSAMQDREFGTNTSRGPRYIGTESGKWLRAANRIERLGSPSAANALRLEAGKILATEEGGVTTEAQGKRKALQNVQASLVAQKKKQIEDQELLNKLEMIRQNRAALSTGKPLPYAAQ